MNESQRQSDRAHKHKLLGWGSGKDKGDPLGALGHSTFPTEGGDYRVPWSIPAIPLQPDIKYKDNAPALCSSHCFMGTTRSIGCHFSLEASIGPHHM